jgi:hypothetical protein
MSDSDHEFSQFRPTFTATEKEESTFYKQGDFDELDPYSSHQHSTTHYQEEREKDTTASYQEQTDKPLLGLDFDSQSGSLINEEGESPIVMIGGVGEAGIDSKDSMMDYQGYEDLLGVDPHTNSSVPQPVDKDAGLIKSSALQSVKSDFEQDYLRDFKPEKPTAPVLDDLSPEFTAAVLKKLSQTEEPNVPTVVPRVTTEASGDGNMTFPGEKLLANRDSTVRSAFLH